MSDSEDRIEAEWQFDLDDLAPVESWLAGFPETPERRLAREASVEHLDTYYDTTDWRVHRAGYALRLRRRTDAAELTLKSLASQAATAFTARRELTEALAPSDDLSSTHLGGPVRERVRALRGRRSLIPLFSAITRRHRYGIWSGATRVGEIALDFTTFIGETFDDQSQLLRVEIETTNGETDTLEPFIAELRAAVALKPATASKFAVGLARNHLTPVGPPVFDEGSFERDVSIGELAYTTLWRQLAEVLRNEPGTRLGDDVEALHDMRVAVRRLRAALSLFRPYLPAEIQALRDEWRWLARALGEVRDLDVQLIAFGGWADRLDVRTLEPMLAELCRRRTNAREQLLAALDSERYERLISMFTELLVQPLDARRECPALAVAPALILKRQKRFARRAAKIKRSASPEALHAVRIEAKRLRYALEFFRPLYGKGVRSYIRRLVEVQDLLGAHQDAVVAVEQLRELARTSNTLPGPTVFAMGQMAERYRTDAEALRARFPKTYRRLKAKPLARLRKELLAGKHASHSPAASVDVTAATDEGATDGSDSGASCDRRSA